MKTPLLLTLVAGLASPLLAQQPPPPPPPGQGQSQNTNQGQGGPEQGQNPGSHRPPPPPLVMALDTNRDGVISADEIAAASTSLKTLDRNGDGQLTREEFGPPPRRGPQGNQNSSQSPGSGN